MAEMRLGYGSEYQLLRFLGHHRDELNKEILNSLKLNNANIHWFDYPKDIKKLSLDSEYTGISFLPNHEQFDEAWNIFWPQSGNTHNWDGIFTINNKYYLVEAKAHISEVSNNGHEHNEQIASRLAETKNYYGITYETNDWEGPYYQQANRLAFIYFLKSKCNIDAELINIFFINGYDKRKLDKNEIYRIENKNVHTKDEWLNEIQKEYCYLGLNTKAKNIIHEVFINCGTEDNFSKIHKNSGYEQITNYSIQELRNMIIPREVLLSKEKFSLYGKPIFSNIDPYIPGEVFRAHPKCKNLEASNYGRLRIITPTGENIIKQKETLQYGWLIPDWPDNLPSDINNILNQFKYSYVYQIVCDIWHGLNPGHKGKWWARHHISNDGYDNRPENLIWIRPSDHRKIHSKENPNSDYFDSQEPIPYDQ